ncbi:hypothetical protein GC207_12080 [bacterium]|nr:hypothetical protein [bacterium]
MKVIPVIRALVAAGLITVGCLALLLNYPMPVAVVCFGLPSLVLASRQRLHRSIRWREFAIAIGVLVVAIAFNEVRSEFFSAANNSERFFRSPSVVVPFWLCIIVTLYGWLKRELRRQLVAGGH